MTIQECEHATLKLIAYCRKEDWAGYDPYDALNSRVLKGLPFLENRFARLALTQVLKRSPVDVRKLLGVPKTQNPKAIGLFLSSFVKLNELRLVNEREIERMIELLTTLRSKNTNYWCWGYSFPWQMRKNIVPAGAPNLVCTTFVANSLLDAYEQRPDSSRLKMAVSAAEYILNELYWKEGPSVGFCYPLPGYPARVHNANFLAAALLCRVHALTGDKRFLEPALAAARYSASRQKADGSWAYGELPTQQWIDNFHTGYNLCALQSICQYAGTTEFTEHLRRGFEFYRTHFFRADGAPKYFHNRTYPLDIHCVAQGIITLLAFKDLSADGPVFGLNVLRWAINHMRDDQGFYYYRVLRTCTIRTSYMRWSQAWMLLALSTVLFELREGASQTRREKLGTALPTEIAKVTGEEGCRNFRLTY